MSDMPLTAYEISGLPGEFVDGPSHLETEVDLELGALGDRVELTQTTRHPAAPDRAVRCELGPEEVEALRAELDDLVED